MWGQRGEGGFFVIVDCLPQSVIPGNLEGNILHTRCGRLQRGRGGSDPQMPHTSDALQFQAFACTVAGEICLVSHRSGSS